MKVQNIYTYNFNQNKKFIRLLFVIYSISVIKRASKWVPCLSGSLAKSCNTVILNSSDTICSNKNFNAIRI